MGRRGKLASLFLLLSLAGAGLGANEPDSRLPELARAGDRAAVSGLLQQDGVDVDAAQVDGTTALHWAAYGDDAGLAAMLLDAGADADPVNRNGSTPLALACANAGTAVVAQLLDAGADPHLAPTGEPPILTCARTGSVAAVRALLAHGADIDAVDAWRGQTPLMWAAAENHVPVMRLLLETGAAVDVPSTGGFTALMFAVRQDARDALRLLVEAAAEVDVRIPDPAAQAAGRPPATGSLLSMAVTIGHYTAAAMLLDAGADPNARDGRGNAILHDLVRARSPQRRVANQFVDATGRDRSQLDGLELMRMLLERGADPNARTEPVPIVHERWTDEGIFSAGRPLMDNRVNLGGATPYLLAAQAADVEAMRVLTAHGADERLATYANNTAAMLAAGVGHVEGSRRFRSEQDALEAVRMALDAGVDVNASNANGQTALHGAVYRAANSIIRRLVEAGARTDFRDELERNPLDLAEQGFNQVASVIRRDKAAALLRELGAVPSPASEDEAGRAASR
ncbi:MAG: ankyrin repeat domain-containing protein [Acidobacteria bacterium]|nr:ankyrin repeat domain-containing protein [Acidobacteriota bacterium]